MTDRGQLVRVGAALFAVMGLVVVGAPGASARASRPSTTTPHGTVAISFTTSSGTIDATDPFVAPGRTPLVGDFVGDTSPTGELDDILWYTPGAGGDELWRTNGDRSWTATNVSISRSYRPIVGQFSGDSKADIFWYSPGSAPDYLWDFEEDGSITKTTYQVNGTYTPVVGRFTADGADDIVWYGPGSAPDAWWDFDGHGGLVRRPLRVNGTYTPVVGMFGGFGPAASPWAADILWYAPGPARDSLWDFDGDAAPITKIPLRIDGTYIPVPGNYNRDRFTDVIWYAPGPAPDLLWTFDFDGKHGDSVLEINGTYTPVVGSGFGLQSSATDIWWFGAGSKPDSMWAFTSESKPIVQPVSLTGDLPPVLASFEVLNVLGTMYPLPAIIDRHS
ncbi:hypothetical protein [Aquihabitans sp. McL0605]|uniref:hypothetical protein n=1 Tax=Aquihabitans sp. McL0605 TaxID=3415671 RepID=UPI003CF5C3A9